MAYFFYRENHACAARFFSSVKRAPAGAHDAPGAQTSLCGAQIEKNIFFFQLKRAPAGAYEAPGSHTSKNIINIYFLVLDIRRILRKKLLFFGRKVNKVPCIIVAISGKINF